MNVLTLFLQAASWAYDFRVDGIYYNVLSSEDLTCEVTYLSTSNSNYSAYQGSVEIPITVEYENATYTVMGISDSAFSGCTALTEITIPEGITSIGSYAFYECSGLKQVTIPEDVLSIGSYAFYGCTKMNQVTIPNSVTSIGSYVFYGCSALTQIAIPEGVATIGNRAFRDCSSLTQLNFNAIACTYVGYPSTDSAFYGCSNITKVNFGDNVTIIPQNLCCNFSKINSITIPNSVNSIGSYAFDHCSKLTEVTIPNSVTSIGSYAFNYCSGLKEVNIGNSVASVGNYAFRYCESLKSITSLNPEPPSCGDSSFLGVSKSSCNLYVPDGSLGVYANAIGWQDFYNIIEIEVDAIEDILSNGNAVATGYYTTDGKQVPALQRGINIIRYSDGIAKKVLVK